MEKTAPLKELQLSIQDLAGLVGLEPNLLREELSKFTKSPLRTATVPPSVVKQYLYAKGFSLRQQVISTQMLKGGVAKTTTTLNLGIRAAMYGLRVLFIDLDQQANLTFSLGVDAEDKPVWVDVIEKKTKLKDILVPIMSGVDLIPSSLNNSVLDKTLMSQFRNWAQAVTAPLSEIKDAYDLILIDTAPNLSLINTAVTVASSMVLLPINPDKFSFLGALKHLGDLKEIREEFSLSFDERILFTKFDGRESSSRGFLEQAMELFEDRLMNHYIRTSTDVKNAIGSGKSIFSSQSKAKEDYDLVTRELIGLPTSVEVPQKSQGAGDAVDQGL